MQTVIDSMYAQLVEEPEEPLAGIPSDRTEFGQKVVEYLVHNTANPKPDWGYHDQPPGDPLRLITAARAIERYFGETLIESPGKSRQRVYLAQKGLSEKILGWLEGS